MTGRLCDLQMVELRCGVQCGPDGNQVCLNGLPNLRRCRLTMVPRRNSRNGVPVNLDAASLTSLGQLQVGIVRQPAAYVTCWYLLPLTRLGCPEHCCVRFLVVRAFILLLHMSAEAGTGWDHAP